MNTINLQHERLVAVSKKPMTMAKFRELLATNLLQRAEHQNTPSTQPIIYYLQETDEREKGKRRDKRKSRYCVGWYRSFMEGRGRDFAKEKAKRVEQNVQLVQGSHAVITDVFQSFTENEIL